MYRFLSKTYVWSAISLVAMIICLDIEYQWIVIPCESLAVAEATNRIVLALSYSYIAATFFHFVVNYCPYRMRQRDIVPLLNYNLWLLKEKIRQSYIVALPPFDISGKVYNRQEYVQRFSSIDLYEDYAFCKGKSKLEHLYELRIDINELITRLFAYREYLSEDVFSFLNDVATSNYITNDIISNNEMCNESYKNQEIIGNSIFDLQEKAIHLDS